MNADKIIAALRNILTSVVVILPVVGQVATALADSIRDLPAGTNWIVLVVTVIGAMTRVSPVDKSERGLT